MIHTAKGGADGIAHMGKYFIGGPYGTDENEKGRLKFTPLFCQKHCVNDIPRGTMGLLSQRSYYAANIQGGKGFI